MIPKEILNATTERSLVSLVNSVGVDVTACMEHPQWAAALQFVCGLGPRKAAYIIRVSDFMCLQCFKSQPSCDCPCSWEVQEMSETAMYPSYHL